MAIKKNPAREAALKEFVKSRGKITMNALSEKVGASVSQLGRWKKLDDWEGALKKKRGAPKGNKNAAGAGAPANNRNAEKHGAYRSVSVADLDSEQRERVEVFSSMTAEQQLNEKLKDYLAKEEDLEQLVKAYRPVIQDGQVFDFMVDDKKVVSENGDKEFVVTTKVTHFQRWIELNKALIENRKNINKILFTLLAHQREKERLGLDERKYELEKQKAVGEFEMPGLSGVENDTE